MMHPGSCAKIRNQQNMILLLKRKFLLIIFLSLIQETRRLTWDNISFTFSVIFSSAIFYTHLLKYVKSNKCKYKILIFRHLFRCILSTRSDFWCIIFIDGTWNLIIMHRSQDKVHYNTWLHNNIINWFSEKNKKI